MYRAFVRREIRKAFARLSVNDTPALLANMAPDVDHVFPTDGPLGGRRTNIDDVAAWFERLFRLLPGLAFQIHTLAVDGWPWNTRVGVEWTNSGTLSDGSYYSNTGSHIIRLRNGKIVAFHAYLHDHAELTDALTRIAASGVTEAGADPIVST